MCALFYGRLLVGNRLLNRRNMLTVTCLLLGLLLALAQASTWKPGDSQPHIVILLADDLGWNDVGWSSSNVRTPTLDALKNESTNFESFYVQPMCSPSRSALLSGYYPVNTGFNTGPLGSTQKAGLELQFKTLAEELKDLQAPLKPYRTHMLGKWHLGSCTKPILPHHRGFDSFTGIYHSGADHFNYRFKKARDLHTNDKVNKQDAKRKIYSSELYGEKAEAIISDHAANHADEPMLLYVAFQAIHSPLKAPSDILDTYSKNKNILNVSKSRRKTLAMIETIDNAVKVIQDALSSNGLLDDTIIVFTSDNGGNSLKGASNYPLRGGKSSWFEGGMKVPAFIYSKLFDGVRDSSCLVHISDIFTTLLKMAGGVPDPATDGIDQWEAITDGTCQRDFILHNVIKENSDLVTGALRDGKWKYIYGDPGSNDKYVQEDGSKSRVRGENGTRGLLFDIEADPEEMHNLSEDDAYETRIAGYIQLLNGTTTYEFKHAGEQNCPKAEALTSNKRFWKPGCCDDLTF